MTSRRFGKKRKVLVIIAVVVISFFALSKTIFGISSLRVIGLRGVDAVFTKLTCVGKNKKYMTWGFAANPVCVTTYNDKGKPCKSSEECQSDLCVRTQNIREPYCRGLSSNYPLCSNGETTVESLAKPQDGPIRMDFLFCD